jgi:hypothetical protein
MFVLMFGADDDDVETTPHEYAVATLADARMFLAAAAGHLAERRTAWVGLRRIADEDGTALVN